MSELSINLSCGYLGHRAWLRCWPWGRHLPLLLRAGTNIIWLCPRQHRRGCHRRQHQHCERCPERHGCTVCGSMSDVAALPLAFGHLRGRNCARGMLKAGERWGSDRRLVLGPDDLTTDGRDLRVLDAWARLKGAWGGRSVADGMGVQ
jgi:hypothetical protein